MDPLNKIVDTYCEAFDGVFVRLLVTAENRELLKRAAFSATALPSTVFGEAEGGVEAYTSDTPDGRPGAIIQLWAMSAEILEKEFGKRVRQGILVVPTTRVFDAFPEVKGEGTVDVMGRVGHCGDGYETRLSAFGRTMISVPLMMGDFLIEEKVQVGRGVMGGNIWILCDSEKSALEAGEKALEAIRNVPGVVTPFDICSAGSKVETNYPEIGPTTNHPYCPTLRDRIPDSKVPEGVLSIPEIVIDGVNLEAVKRAMSAGLRAVAGLPGVRALSAGNYGGKLGKYHIRLHDIV